MSTVDLLEKPSPLRADSLIEAMPADRQSLVTPGQEGTFYGPGISTSKSALHSASGLCLVGSRNPPSKDLSEF